VSVKNIDPAIGDKHAIIDSLRNTSQQNLYEKTMYACHVYQVNDCEHRCRRPDKSSCGRICGEGECNIWWFRVKMQVAELPITYR
jgi:hypothetical protein